MNAIIEIITADVWWKAVLAFLGIAFPVLWSSFQRRQLAQAKNFHREEHNLNLLRNLADPNPGTQMAVAAILVTRLKKTPQEDSDISDRHTFIMSMISVTKYEGASAEFCKAVADAVPRALDVLFKDSPKAQLAATSPMRDFDWQGARLSGGYWRGIDARKVDFFRAQLIDIGMRNSYLSGAIFKEAVLRECVLEGADLSGADLRGADLRGTSLKGANLKDAKLEGAVYDETTVLPDGFDPGAALMVRSASKELAA